MEVTWCVLILKASTGGTKDWNSSEHLLYKYNLSLRHALINFNSLSQRHALIHFLSFSFSLSNTSINTFSLLNTCINTFSLSFKDIHLYTFTLKYMQSYMFSHNQNHILWYIHFLSHTHTYTLLIYILDCSKTSLIESSD